MRSRRHHSWLKGFNASLGASSQHDSSNGWSSLLIAECRLSLQRVLQHRRGRAASTSISTSMPTSEPRQSRSMRYAARNGRLRGHVTLLSGGRAAAPGGWTTARPSRWGCRPAIPALAWAQDRSPTTSTTTLRQYFRHVYAGHRVRRRRHQRAGRSSACGRATSRSGRWRTSRRAPRSICR